MRRAALPLITVPLAVLALAASRAQEPAPIAWRRDLAAAREEARAAGKPLFMVFRCEP